MKTEINLRELAEKEIAKASSKSVSFIELNEINGIQVHPVLVNLADIVMFGCSNQGETHNSYMIVRGRKDYLYLDNKYDEIKHKILDDLGKTPEEKPEKVIYHFRVVNGCSQVLMAHRRIFYEHATGKYYGALTYHDGEFLCLPVKETNVLEFEPTDGETKCIRRSDVEGIDGL